MSILKKTVLAGIGFASLTRQKAEELADYLIKSGELSQSEKKEAVLELLAKAEAKAEAGAAQAKDKIGREVEKARKSLGVAKTSEIEALTKRVEALGRKVARLEKTVADLEAKSSAPIL